MLISELREATATGECRRERGSDASVDAPGQANPCAAPEPTVRGDPTGGGDALTIERSWVVLPTIAFAVTALVAALAPSVR